MARGIATGLGESNGVVFSTVPAGVYTARIMKVEDVVAGPASKYFGAAMVKLTFRIISDDPVLDGRQLTSQQLMPGDKRMDAKMNKMQVDSIKRTYVALGLPVQGDEYDTDDWQGQECRIVVIEKTHPTVPEKMVNNISDLLPIA